MKVRRKATVDPVKVVVGFMVALLVGGVLYAIFFTTTRQTAEQISPYQMLSINRICATRAGLGLGEVKEDIEGAKKDGYDDSCDTCLGGDNRKVSNSYGMADDCYAKPDGKKIRTVRDMCWIRGGCYISEKTQCCIGEARSKCGTECKGKS